MEQQVYSPKEYRSDIKPVWCPGCGDFGVLNAIYQALSQMRLAPHEVAIVSGIGCSSRLPGYVKTYGFNSIHGRALPVAEGVKLAKQELTVLAVAGDGDGLSIGAGHFPHTARRNIDITYIMLDNSIYGMTKGQMSPTTREEQETKTTPYGLVEDPINPVNLALAYGATFIARSFSGNVKHTVEMIKLAVQHRGFSFLHLLSPCVTFVGKNQFDLIRSLSVDLDSRHDPTSLEAAWRVAQEKGQISMGVIYQVERATFEQRYDVAKFLAREEGDGDFQHLLKKYRVAA